ncbi:MAG: rhomboid family intramembrane serine protease [Marinilabiliales bacterium]|nr:MAG: rhomboid family intramembrane serine protease [Marinilabiliales bacterium]
MQEEQKRFFYSLIFPSFFLIIIWIIKITEVLLNINFVFLGIYPLKLKGLIGIITAPLIHSDFQHLIANSIPILILGTGLFYFYNKIAYKVFFLSYFIANIWIWFGARQAYHIGASGLVYSFASFLFVSGVIRKNIKLMAISLLVVFLYGSMVWGLLPLQPHISWESHLMGAIAGMILAIYYRESGPRRKIYSWEFEDEEEDLDEEDKYWEIDTQLKEKQNEK